MSELQLETEWLLVSLIATFLLGLVGLFAGRRLARRADWTALAALAIPMLVLVVQWITRSEISFDPVYWQKGWIRPGERGMDLGIVEDPVGFTVSILILMVLVALVTQRRLVKSREGGERANGAISIAAAGAVVAWIAGSLWMGMIGLGLVLFSGFMVFASDWNDAEEAALATRFARESVFGFLLAMLGAAALAGLGASLSWVSSDARGFLGSAQGWIPELAAGIMIAGLVFLSRPAPFLGWLIVPGRGRPAPSTIIGQAIPATAAFALLWRMQPGIVELRAFDILGWCSAGFGILGAVSGLLQREPVAALRCWLSSVNCLAISAMLSGSAWPALAIHVVALVASAAWILLCGDPEGDRPNRIQSRWTFAGSVLAALIVSGAPGFLAAGAFVFWIGAHQGQPALAAIPGVALFLSGLLAWRVALLIRRIARPTSWWNTVLPSILLLSTMAWIWTGSLSGGVIPGNPDLLLESLLEPVFVAGAYRLNEQAWLLGAGIAGAAFILSMGIGLWMMRGGRDFAVATHRKFPRASGHIEASYRLDSLFTPVLRSAERVGEVLVQRIDGTIWDFWLPKGLEWFTGRVGRLCSGYDQVLVRFLNRNARRGVEVPGKVLQLVQSGNVQWYLLFAVGSGVAMLLHFLRF